ncbi:MULTISPECIES: hypothetical protein [unclassified Halomonas]|uniref:hypothetical protein n=1 Tax=unclassified Halomonas TaxID=2609666 RepID=UPI00209FFD37|nr:MULTISPECIES: hypothetical protein [unclassified Halomonas]MCP1313544.1 hypothetical protein [Halomonas sp. 707D7]MCP1326923.1 hypothetical protein [Halomonas sp. 707D4]
MNRKTYLAASIALVSAGLLSGCGSSDETPESLSMLDYIPADSPYFMAARETLPEQEVFDFYQRSMIFDGTFGEELDTVREMREASDSDEERALLSLVIAMGEELEGVETLDDLHAKGLSISPQTALYGLGMLPVLRFELEDGAAFRETLERVLARAELEPQVATTDGIDYWVLNPQGDLAVIMSIVDEQALLALVPRAPSDELMALVLGKTLPENSLEDSGELAEIESRHGFTPYGAGQIHTARVLDELGSPTHAGTRALMEAIDKKPLDLSSCQADIDRITARLPGVAMGARAYDLQGRSEFNVILETDDEIVGDLRRLLTPVPGLGERNGLASMGVGLQLPALLENVQLYARQMREDPFGCDELQALNSTWDDANAMLSNPVAMMIAPSLSGINLRLDRLYVERGMPAATGLLTLASPNPMTLVQTAGSFLPELAELKLVPGGEAKRVESFLLPPETPDVFAAMSNSALAVGVGLDNPSNLKEGLAASEENQDLLAHVFLSGDIYHAFADIAPVVPDDQLSDTDIETFRRYGDLYELMEYWLKIDDAGLEIGFAVEMAEQ